MTTQIDDVEEARLTLLDALERRTDAEVAALDTDQKACDLDRIFAALIEHVALHRAAAVQLREAQHYYRLACKHEDTDETAWAAVALEHCEHEELVSQEQWIRLHVQWQRHWQALLHHRIPDAVYDALLTIAEAEHRTFLEQMVLFLTEAVSQWQEKQGGILDRERAPASP